MTSAKRKTLLREFSFARAEALAARKLHESEGKREDVLELLRYVDLL